MCHRRFKMLTRREFVKNVSLATGGVLAGAGVLNGCVTTGNDSLINDFSYGDSFDQDSPENKLKNLKLLKTTLENYDEITKDWDPIYGPKLLNVYYGGPHNFENHERWGGDGGVDYDVPIGTPLAPTHGSRLHAILENRVGGNLLWFKILVSNYGVCYAHLHNNFFNDYNYKTKSYPIFANKEQIIALSGSSGIGPQEKLGRMEPHLHFGLTFNKTLRKGEGYLVDPEKYGLDGGKPVFWDGETDLDIVPSLRKHKLERVLDYFEKKLESWPKDKDLQELKGNLLENYHLIDYNNAKEILDSKHFHDMRELLEKKTFNDKDFQELKGKLVKNYDLMGNIKAKQILDSKHFHDMRALLKKKTLEEKMYIPGTKPYSLMMEIVGYSTDEKQEIILTLPFIAPRLKHLYKVFGD